MGFDLSAFLAIFPDFLIAGVLSLLFYLELRNVKIHRKEVFVGAVPSTDSQSNGAGNPKETPELSSNGMTFFYSIAKNVQLSMLAINVWILLTIVLLPSSSIARLLPSFSFDGQLLIYSILGALFVVSFLSTIILRVSNTKPRMIMTLLMIAAGTFLLFYIPSMQWISGFSLLVRMIILYAIIASTLFLSYGFFVLPSGKIEKLSVAGTFSTYIFTSGILFVNLFHTLLI